MSQLAAATRCAESAEVPSSAFELLVSAAELASWHAGYVEAALMDLQLAIDRAFEDGELTIAPALQLSFAWRESDVRQAA